MIVDKNHDEDILINDPENDPGNPEITIRKTPGNELVNDLVNDQVTRERPRKRPWSRPGLSSVTDTGGDQWFSDTDKGGDQEVLGHILGNDLGRDQVSPGHGHELATSGSRTPPR